MSNKKALITGIEGYTFNIYNKKYYIL